MAISFVNSNTGLVSGTALDRITIPMPAGLAEGDVVIVGTDTGGGNLNRVLSETSGTWTKIADLYGDDTVDCNFGAFLKVMGPVPDTDITVLISAGVGQWSGISAAWRGVDNTTPLDVAVQTATGIDGIDAAPPAITSVSNGCEIVLMGAASENTGSVTFPSGYGNTLDLPGTSNNNRTMFCSKAQGSAGLETPGVFDITTVTATDSWAAITVALRPAPASPSISITPGTSDAKGDTVSPGVGLSSLIIAPAPVSAAGSISPPSIGSLLPAWKFSPEEPLSAVWAPEAPSLYSPYA